MKKIWIVDTSQIVDVQVDFQATIVATKINSQDRDLSIDEDTIFHIQKVLLLEKQISKFAQSLKSKPKQTMFKKYTTEEFTIAHFHHVHYE